MTMQTLRLYSEPYYTLTTQLSSKTYRITIIWNAVESAWYMALKSLSDDSVDLKGVKLVGGVDLLEPYGLPDLGALWVLDMSGAKRDPDYDTLATDFLLGYET